MMAADCVVPILGGLIMQSAFDAHPEWDRGTGRGRGAKLHREALPETRRASPGGFCFSVALLHRKSSGAPQRFRMCSIILFQLDHFGRVSRKVHSTAMVVPHRLGTWGRKGKSCCTPRRLPCTRTTLHRHTSGVHLRLPTCPLCGEMLLAPMLAEHVSGSLVHNHWACESCGYTFRKSFEFVPRREPIACNA